MGERCPTCGADVRVVQSHEGTAHFEPLTDALRAENERLRRELADDRSYRAAWKRAEAEVERLGEALRDHVAHTHDGFGDPPCSCGPCKRARAALRTGELEFSAERT